MSCRHPPSISTMPSLLPSSSSSKSSLPSNAAAAADPQHVISYTFDGKRNDSHIQNMSTTTFEFDLIIIGMGPSAIGLLHHLLTSNRSSPPSSSYRIAIVERGGGGDYFSHDKTAETPSSSSSLNQWFESSHSPSSPHSDIHRTTPQRKLHNRILELPCGRGLGGGTLINAGLAIPPESSDFETWPGIWKGGDAMKEACDTLVKFMKERGDGLDDFYACEEYLNVCGGGNHVGGIDKTTNATTSSGSSSTTLSFVSSFMTCTSPRRDSHCPNRRCDYFTSLIRPLLDDDNNNATVPSVTFFLHTQAERILFNDDDDADVTATGVECTQTHPPLTPQKPILFTLTATRRIVLCGGAILSPALLLVSGIGTPPPVSNSRRIAPRIVASNPHVGRHLRDHVLLPRAFLAPSLKRRRSSRNGIQSWYRGTTTVVGRRSKEKEEVWKMQYHLGDGTNSAFAIAHMVASLCHRGAAIVPPHHHHPENRNDNVTLRRRLSRLLACSLPILSRFLFLAARFALTRLFRYVPFVRYIIDHHTTTILTCLLNPRSTGYVTIRSRRRDRDDSDDDDDATMMRLSDVDIVVDPCYLTHPRDSDMLEAAWSTSALIAQRHFSSSSSRRSSFFFVEILPSFLVTRSNPTRKWSLMLYAKEFLTSYYHYCGSCAMGLVVDDRCRVLRGRDDDDDDDEGGGGEETSGVVKNLMVCDASVFPSCVAGPTALPCAGLGYVVGGLLSSERD